MKSLIVGDVHDNIYILKQIIARYIDSFDEIVILGDWFDSYTEEKTKMAKLTAEAIKEYIDNPKMVFLYGNHDFHYAYPKCGSIRGSGFSRNKADMINRILSKDDWGKFKFFHETQGFVLSHAGFHNGLFHPVKGFDAEFISARIKEELSKIKMADDRNKARFSPDFSCCDELSYFGIGEARGGRLSKGGFLWQDWDTEFVPVEGINQIVGHTHGSFIREKIYNNSANLNIDCFPNAVLIIEDGRLNPVEIKIEG